MKVLIASNRLAREISRLHEMIPPNIKMVIPKTWSNEELIQLAHDVEIIICVYLSAEVVQAAQQLKLIQKTGAGVDAIPFNALKEEVFVANTSGSNPVPMAEGCVALVLALAKRIVQRHNMFQLGEMERIRGIELRGKKAGIIGLGSIGVNVAHLLKAFEMKILALKRQPIKDLKTKLGFDYLGGPNDLESVLKEADFVIITAPLTPMTRGMIGERELRLMKPTTFIINVARAAIIQEEPLYRALTEGWIAGAAIDVWWPPHWWDPTWNPSRERPLYPIWKLPNVIAIPHCIGFVDETSNAGIRIIAENIRRIAQGEPPINQVDKKLQY